MVGSIQYVVTQVPNGVSSVRKSAAAPPLALNSILTPAEAANLVVTRTGGSGLGPVIPATAAVGIRSRTYITGVAAPAFTIAPQSQIDALKVGNFWEPNFPTSGIGTRPC